MAPPRDERNNSYLSKLESDIKPEVIFFPVSLNDVSQFVKLVDEFVQDKEARIAIRGAGCQPFPGCANIEDGITIVLSRLLGTELDKGRKIIRISARESPFLPQWRWWPSFIKDLDYAFSFQDPTGSYGHENRIKLQDTSQKYNPKGLFQPGVPGGFKLFH
ncbi:uncharacterized protein PG998_013037 [Apiospora kogelbergensis]|uniref:uncharacterized protein n=1 Tax=Apiospora kogelbergensis TaxID=1337665 RepID=UPI00312CF598